MIKDINDFITIKRLKSGEIKIKHPKEKEVNIYKLLYELGYRMTRVEEKPVFYFRNKFEVLPSSMSEIREAYRDYLKQFNFINVTNDINSELVMECYYGRQPIKNNGLLEHYLKGDDLTNAEANKLLNVRK